MLRHSASAKATADRSFGRILLAAALFAGGLIGVAGLWVAWPRTSNTSPLAALFAFAWSCTYLVAASLTWRGSRLAAPAFVAATAFLLPVFSLIFPGNWSLAVPPLAMTVVVAILGYRYLCRPGAHAAERPVW
jgi:hypothetical protein